MQVSGGPQRAPGLTFPLGLAGRLGIGLVVFSGVFEPRNLVAEGILKTYQRILHPRRRLSLRKAHLVLGYPQRFKHSIFVVARERECIWIRHIERIRRKTAVEKGKMKTYGTAPHWSS